MNRRYELFKQAKVPNIHAYRRATGKPLPTLWIIHDEFADWMQTEDYKDSVPNIVGRLSVKARAAGIFLLFAAQRPDKDVMPMQLRSQLGNRLILKVDNAGTAEIAMGNKNSGAERLLGRGHMLAKTGDTRRGLRPSSVHRHGTHDSSACAPHSRSARKIAPLAAMIYLDNNATTQPTALVVEAMLPYPDPKSATISQMPPLQQPPSRVPISPGATQRLQWRSCLTQKSQSASRSRRERLNRTIGCSRRLPEDARLDAFSSVLSSTLRSLEPAAELAGPASRSSRSPWTRRASSGWMHYAMSSVRIPFWSPSWPPITRPGA